MGGRFGGGRQAGFRGVFPGLPHMVLPQQGGGWNRGFSPQNNPFTGTGIPGLDPNQPDVTDPSQDRPGAPAPGGAAPRFAPGDAETTPGAQFGGDVTGAAPGGEKPGDVRPDGSVVPLTPEHRQRDAGAAAAGQPNSSGAPARVLNGARNAALLGGPGAVAQWMRNQGFPMHHAWCGDFAAAVMRSQGLPVPKDPSIASNWRNWGRRVAVPRPGDVAVRQGAPTGATGSHVTIVRALSPDGRHMLVTGGNQGGPRGMPTTHWVPTANYSFHSMRYTPGVDENSTLYAHGLGG